MYKEKLWNWFE